MPIEAGQQLLHYRLIEKIGEGGMGQVWKALDTTLGREVAIKVLPEAWTGNANLVARLEREAKLLGSLNHPNVATVHGLHVDPEDDTTRFLVMELVAGEDLFDRIARGPVPPDEALEIARQIAEGLEAAHAAGVIHRDLKPANVRVDPDGRVKVLDFGLARAFERDPASGEDIPTRSTTLTSDHTIAGAILGTAAYMSPEQARGQSVDGRTDVWAFGVVLYEMLAGRAAFKGETVSDTLASVLKVELDFDALPPDVPRRLRRLLNRCLQKDRRARLHHIADARILLEETQAGDAEGSVRVAEPGARKRERGMWIAGLALAAVAAAFVGWALRPAPPEPPHRKLVLALDGEDPDDPDLDRYEISRDGTRLAYRNGKKIFVRDLDDWASREITAAEGASSIFWSPDGASLGFYRDDALWRVSPDGGAASKIADLPQSTGGHSSWGADGAIVMTGTVKEKTGLWTVPERGGELKQVVVVESGHFHGVSVLPDGRGILTTLHARPEMHLGVVSKGAFKKLFAIDTAYMPDPRYATTGHLIYHRGGTNVGIWARPFSLKKLELTGEPFLVVAGAGGGSVADNGVLVFRWSTDSVQGQLVWVDRAGERLETIGEAQSGTAFPSLSPDNRQLAVRIGPEDDKDIWIIDLDRGAQTRLTFEEGPESDPVWTPDGKRVLYTRREGDRDFLMITDADGGSEPEELGEMRADGLSPSGRYLVTQKWGKETKGDLWVRDLEGEAEAVRLVGTAADERQGQVSPDGEFLAYASDESGRFEIYLKRFPSGENKWQVSVDGGTRPRWNPQGGELFWADGKTWMRAAVKTRPSLALGSPEALFTLRPDRILRNAEFDVSSDGKKFVLVAPEEGEEDSLNQVMLVENWFGGG